MLDLRKPIGVADSRLGDTTGNCSGLRTGSFFGLRLSENKPCAGLELSEPKTCAVLGSGGLCSQVATYTDCRLAHTPHIFVIGLVVPSDVAEGG